MSRNTLTKIVLGQIVNAEIGRRLFDEQVAVERKEELILVFVGR